MDWHKGDHRHRLHSQSSTFSLGYIFDNPVAFEDSSSTNRKKIDLGSFTPPTNVHLKCRIRPSDPTSPSSRSSKKMESMSFRKKNSNSNTQKTDMVEVEVDEEEEHYNPADESFTKPSRRRLFASTPTDVLLPACSDSTTSSGTSVTPLLDDCEIYSELSSPAVKNHVIKRLTAARQVLRSPSSSSSSDESDGTDGSSSLRSLRSLDELEEESKWSVKLESIEDSLSRRGSFRSMKAHPPVVDDGTFVVYPGWSMWNRKEQRSYRSLTQANPSNSLNSPETSGKSSAFSTVRSSLKTSLYHHLVAAAGQRYHSLSYRSTSTRTILSSSSRSTGTTNSSSNSKCTCRKLPDELPLLKVKSGSRSSYRSKRRSWEPVSYLRNGLRSLASRGFSQDGFSLHSVIPLLPGCGIPRFEHRKLLPERRWRRSCSVEDSVSSLDVTSRLKGYGFLQCVLRNGVMSYSFWMDEENGEVLVAKPEQGREKCIRFYTCKAERSRWRNWQRRIRRRVVNLVGTMNFSCYVYSELSSKGQVTHFMDSEFSLLDERRQVQVSTRKKHGLSTSEYLRALWRKSVESSEGGGVKSRKELSAVVVRAPLEVRKDESKSRELVTSSWSSILGSTGESVHVILPRGEHGHPTCGLDGPRPLAERWRSGGLCDCGSWDLGCGMITLSRDLFQRQELKESKDGSCKPEMNITLEGTKERVVAMSLASCEDGLYRLSFQKPMLALQAFAAAVAILHGKLNTGEFSSCFRSQENQTKLPVILIGSRHPNPPLSPNDRV